MVGFIDLTDRFGIELGSLWGFPHPYKWILLFGGT